MYALKHKLVLPPALVSIDYFKNAGSIILGVDANLEGWGATLIQIVDRKQHPARYKSEVWLPQEKMYDAIKQECQRVFKALKKVRHWLYGVHFILETNANVFVSQLNGANTDVLGALIVRWVAWI